MTEIWALFVTSCNVRGTGGFKCSTRRQRCIFTSFTERVRYTVIQSRYKQTNPIRDGERGSSFIQSRVVTRVVGGRGKGTGKEKANTESITQARVVIVRTLELMENAGTLETRGKQRRTGNETGTHSVTVRLPVTTLVIHSEVQINTLDTARYEHTVYSHRTHRNTTSGFLREQDGICKDVHIIHTVTKEPASHRVAGSLVTVCIMCTSY